MNQVISKVKETPKNNPETNFKLTKKMNNLLNISFIIIINKNKTAMAPTYTIIYDIPIKFIPNNII